MRRKSLKSWIDEVGVTYIAELLDIEPSTVRHWRRGRSNPKDEFKMIIKEHTGGVVGYTELIEGRKYNAKRS